MELKARIMLSGKVVGYIVIVDNIVRAIKKHNCLELIKKGYIKNVTVNRESVTFKNGDRISDKRNTARISSMDEIEWYEVNAKEYAAGGYSSRQLVGAVINRFTGMVIGYRFKTGDGTYSNIAIEELTRATGQFRVSRQLDDKFIAKYGDLFKIKTSNIFGKTINKVMLTENWLRKDHADLLFGKNNNITIDYTNDMNLVPYNMVKQLHEKSIKTEGKIKANSEYRIDMQNKKIILLGKNLVHGFTRKVLVDIDGDILLLETKEIDALEKRGVEVIRGKLNNYILINKYRPLLTMTDNNIYFTFEKYNKTYI